MHDDLTELPKRTLALDRHEQAIATAQRSAAQPVCPFRRAGPKILVAVSAPYFAEDVETEAQFAFSAAHDCDEI